MNATLDQRLPETTTGRTGSEFAIRAVNILVASLAILVAAPVMILAAVLVRLSSPGPIIFSQPRVGLCARSGRDRRGPSAARSGQDRRQSDRGGLVFTIYKFRTMTVAEAREEWATPENPRITPIGGFMRKTRIDELPQLFNVLLGDMNLVGPRPEQPGIFSTLRESVDSYGRRQKVRPGITGLAQVSLGYDQSVDDVKKKVEKDLEYIADRTLWTDLKIMAKTLPVMLLRKGAI